MRTGQLRSILKLFPRQTVMVVGDVMLDQFLWGKVSRISPEAPVPVVEVTRESCFPGGAANVARNLYELGAKVHALGIVGRDREGEILRRILHENRVNTRGLLTDARRRTTVKSRIVAHNQQVVRFDRESVEPISSSLEDKLLHQFIETLPKADAVVFEDYAKGLFTQALLDEMLGLARKQGIITAADPNPRRVLDYRQLTAVTPNRHEAFAAASVSYAEAVDDVLHDAALMSVGDVLLDKWEPENLLITLGEHGMCLFRRGKRPHHIPTVAQEVFDVSGAGDTVIATLVVALAAGADPVTAAEISNYAAGVVVGKIGTATCSPGELLESFARSRR